MLLPRRECLALLALAAATVPGTGCGRKGGSAKRRDDVPPEEPVALADEAPPEIARPRPDPLAQRFPSLAAACPMLPLAHLPSPVEHAASFGAELRLSGLWIKRDDALAPVCAGGKVRKLAYYLAEARALGAEEIVTLGALGSNQAVATAAHAAREGFRARALLAPTPLDAAGRKNLLATVALGAQVELVSGVAEGLRLARERAAKDKRLYVVPPGGSSPLGTLGFVRAGLELAEQIRRDLLPEPSRLYVPLGTMGTALGLALGLAASGLRTRVYAVRVSSAATSSKAELARLLGETMRWLSAREPLLAGLAPPEIVIVGSELGAGYGAPTPGARRAVEAAARHGLALETTYAGKCLAALMADAPTLSGVPIVFWNTHSSLPLPGDESDVEKLPKALAAVVRNTERSPD